MLDLLPAITTVIFLGVFAHWLSWRFQIPSIILLLLFGLLVGPFTGLIYPDAIFGDMLTDLVALGVALILFEGGLNLRIEELKTTGNVVRNLITVGVAVTWIVGAGLAVLLLDLPVSLALLLGAILVVSGPTVIGPLLRQVRLPQRTDAALEWESILIDPVGALLAVLVFEVIITTGTLADGTAIFILGLMKIVSVSTLLGLGGGLFLTRAIQRYWIPDYLYNPVALALVVFVFTASNMVAHESGLLAVTLMGIFVGNQRSIAVRDLSEFKEDLRVLIISALFILLTARLKWDSLIHVDGGTIVYVVLLILVCRPLAVMLSTIGSRLNFRERIFVALMAPRGIVAAAVASIFSLQLMARGYPDADQLVPLTFFVIIVTVIFYSSIAGPLSRMLKIAEPHPSGFLLIGAHLLARQIGLALQQTGTRVLLLDNQRDNINEARMAGLRCHYGNIFSNSIRLSGIGRLLALSPNNELNALAVLHYLKIFDQVEVYQLPPEGERDENRPEEILPKHLRGRYLFKKSASFSYLFSRVLSGAVVKKVKLTANFSYPEFSIYYRHTDIAMFVADDAGNVTVITHDAPFHPKPGQHLIALVNPRSDEKRQVTGGRKKKSTGFKIVKG
ncbi:MAG: cation:proton antiporter [Thermodesulfobacteriota bacterium]